MWRERKTKRGALENQGHDFLDCFLPVLHSSIIASVALTRAVIGWSGHVLRNNGHDYLRYYNNWHELIDEYQVGHAGIGDGYDRLALSGGDYAPALHEDLGNIVLTSSQVCEGKLAVRGCVERY